jgi:AcrR family transcriptional regulator
MQRPKKPSPRTRDPEQSRRRILDAALELVGEGGPDRITHRSVAERAGISLGSTTYHFGSREELIRAAFRRYLAEAKVMLSEIAAPRGKATDVAEMAVAGALLGIREPVRVRAEFELILYSASDPVVAREFLAYERAVEGGLALILEGLDVRRPTDAARTIVDMVRGFELERFARPDADPEDLGRRVRSFVAGLVEREGPRPTRSTARRRAAPRRTYRPRAGGRKVP